MKEPKIRFKGDKEPWTVCKAKEVFRPTSEKGYPNLPVLSASQEEGMVRRDEIGINMSYSLRNVDGYKRVMPGNFVIHLRSFQGGFAHSSIEGITSPAYTVLQIKDTDKQDDNYWKHLMTSRTFIESLKLVTYGIRDGRNINVSEFLELPIAMLSSKSEQKAIADFFDNLNQYIASEGKKLNKLCNLKNAYLENMFPKDGEDEPEIRLGEYQEKWVCKPLKSYLQTKVERNENDEYNKYDIFSVSGDYGVVNQIAFQGKSFAGASLKGYKVTHKGQIIYTKSPLRLQPYGIIKANKATDGIVSTLYAVYDCSDLVDADFIQNYFELDSRLNSYLRPLVNKGAKNTLLISDDDALNGLVCFPPTKSEQTAISTFFSSLDTYISASTKKLEKLRSIRKGLLERMFVGNEKED